MNLSNSPKISPSCFSNSCSIFTVTKIYVKFLQITTF